jgi:hypothetical protein
MPIQLTWQPNATPAVSSSPRFGLELTGEDATLPTVTDGRVKLLELPDTGRNKGSAEPSSPRLIATFHGKFHSKATAPRATRITFEIFTGPGTFAPHVPEVQGFDPECIFGLDVFVLTFVNREFLIWFPFNVDSRTEGGFLEIVAVAEIGSGSTLKELGRSMVLNLPLERSHAVDTTSIFNRRPLAYTGRLFGDLIVTHRDYIILGQAPNPHLSTPSTIVIEPAFFPVKPGGTSPAFTPYPANSMKILLLKDLLDDLVPSDSFLTSSIRGAIVPAQVRRDALKHFRDLIKQGVLNVFTDAGFTGAQVFWQDEAAASSLVATFTGAFMFQTLGGRFWRLLNSSRPLATPFWTFFVGSSDATQTAGTGEEYEFQGVTPITLAGKQAFLPYPVPIGGGTKPLKEIIRIAVSTFENLLTTQSGVTRTFKSVADFNDAVDKVAGKMVILICHEVGHSLGLMHHCRVETPGNFDENDGSPVLSIMSAGVESGGFGVGLTFCSQVKDIWADAFHVSPTFNDTIFQNKTWTPAEVFTVDWSTRTSRFIQKHGEVSIARPGLASSGTPQFASAPPRAQRGTFIP